MPLKIYIEGKLYDKKNAKISVLDRGLLYGDGVFEGIRVYKRLVFRLKEHLDRLYESAHTLMLDMPLTKDQMAKAICDTLKANKLNDAYIRLIVTRGIGDLGLDPRKCMERARVIIITDKIALYPAKLYKEGLCILTVPTQQSVSESLNPQIKSLNYLNNILAKIEAINAGCEEAIMLNSAGYVTECTGDNIFILKNNILYTPPTHVGLLEGITRDAVMQIARARNIELKDEIFTRHDIYNADECFLTGTAAEIIPVRSVDGRVIGSGKPGKATAMFTKEFRKLTKSDGMRY
ncbi:MAG: branched-chain-amino-acid transaminase [Candidatus Omnitrophica bacterium]|nr:branched-chain-amino-acid transaminase [Candidatus Omnitrophota bacterium]